MKLSIIIVSYNTNEFLKKCLTSIYKRTKDILFEVIVVDNASIDGTQEMIQREFPQVKLILNIENLGFAAGNNIGIKQACGDNILLLNPDTEILNGTLRKTLSFMEANHKIGIAGCKLLFPDGSLQRSVRSFPTLWNMFCETTFLYLLFPTNKRSGIYGFSYMDYKRNVKVDWVSGAFLMLRKTMIDEIGMLDEQFFVYSEEVDLCYRAQKAGWEVWFCADAAVYHSWQGANCPSRRSIVWAQGAQYLFVDKHFTGLYRIIVKTLIYAGITIRIFAYGMLGLLLMKRYWIKKATHQLVALYKLHSKCWKYQRGASSFVYPWPQF